MQHLHFESCHSTQKYLQDLLKDNDSNDFLVSCDFQDSGVGQKDKKWDCYKNTLCFSFNAPANEVLNLTSLEIGVQICQFFQIFFETSLYLKWPNDILNEKGEKVGGIIINKSGESRPIIGIGLNIAPDKDESIHDYEITAGFIFESFPFEKKLMAQKLYQFIIGNRLSAAFVRHQWIEQCFHRNQEVSIIENGEKFEGEFLGIGQYGQALILIQGKTKEFYTGTLRPTDLK